MPHPAANCRPFFLPAGPHRLFATVYAGPAASRAVLIAPPFCEEMNRCRHTLSVFGRRAAAAGILTLQLDLYGTGDSDGDFSAATWAVWLEDLQRGLDWLRAAGFAAPTILGVRAGCLLATALLAADPACARDAVFWQPVPNGRLVVTELLRMRLAGGLGGTGTGPGTAELHARLEAGELVETGGYALGSALALPLEGVSLGDLTASPARLHWLEISGGDTPVRAVAQSLAARLGEAGTGVRLLPVVDPPFWTTAETTLGEATVQTTLAELGATRDD